MMDVIVFSLVVAEQIRRGISPTKLADQDVKGQGQQHGDVSILSSALNRELDDFIVDSHVSFEWKTRP